MKALDLVMDRNKQLVIKSNFLVEASYRLSSIEQKIILTLATKIKNTDKEFQKYFFNLGELGNFLELKTNADYVYLREVTKNLLSKVLTIKKENSILQTHWLESVEYFESQGEVALNFNPELKPFLIQLKNNFTKYQLKYAIQLKSLFSIRVYELLKQYEKISHRDFLLKDLRERLGIKNEEYPFYGNFKAKVLLVAQKELKEKTDISFEFEEIKIGRGVGKIRFLIKSEARENAQLTGAEEIQNVSDPQENEPPENEDLKKLIALLPQDFQEKQSLRNVLNTWLEKQNYDYVARNIEYSNDRSNEINPDTNLETGSNYRNYLTKALIGDYGLAHKEDKEAKRKARESAKQKAQREAIAEKQKLEELQNDRVNQDRVKVFQQSLAPEELQQLKDEAFSRMDPQQQELFKKKTLGSDRLLKIMMTKISLEHMKTSTQRRTAETPQ